MRTGSEEFYLFSQAYRKSVEEYYARGVCINNAVKHAKAHNDFAISKTMDKIPMYVRFIEREYNFEVLEKTKKRGARNSRLNCA